MSLLDEMLMSGTKSKFSLRTKLIKNYNKRLATILDQPIYNSAVFVSGIFRLPLHKGMRFEIRIRINEEHPPSASRGLYR